MNDLTTRTTQLPDTLEDLSTFVLVSRAKLQAYMLKLKTVNRLKDAQDIREQTFKEAQEVANALIAAEQRIGEILLSIPKASGQYAESENRPTSKNTIASDMGYSKDQVSDYQRMAENPNVVRMVLEKAQADGKVVSHTQVMREIRELAASKRALEEQNEMLKKQVLDPKVVPPKDYSEVKAKAKAYDAETKRLNTKLEDAYKKRNALEDEIRELKEQTARERMNSDAVAGAIYFIAQCGSFIRDVGGYVWLADKIADLPPRECEGYIKAAMAVRDWATVLLQNIERNDYGKQEIARINAESTAE